MNAKTCSLIVNANAGSADLAVETLVAAAERRGSEYAITRSADESSRAVTTAIENGKRRIIIAGGDGTIHHIVNLLGSRLDSVELGVVPLGTGNDLARALEIPIDDVEASFERAVDRPSFRVDYVRVNADRELIVVNAATGGIGAAVSARLSPDVKQRWKWLAYWQAAATQLTELTSHDVRIVADGETIERKLYGVAIANGCFVGGGFPLVDEACLDDGLIHVTLIPELPILDLVAAGAAQVLGDPAEEGPVETFLARHIRIESEPAMLFSFDGELSTNSHVQFETIAGGLRLVDCRNDVAREQSNEGDLTRRA